jgi:hypothetical protein
MVSAVVFNHTIAKTIENFAFGGLPRQTLLELFGDGRIFSHFMERILEQDYALKHVPGCQGHDLIDSQDASIKYEQKTFTRNGCKFMPSNMIGQGRHFDQVVFDEKVKHLIYIIVSNIHFPELKIRFVKGPELAAMYPRGEIKIGDHDKFFQNDSPVLEAYSNKN